MVTEHRKSSWHRRAPAHHVRAVSRVDLCFELCKVEPDLSVPGHPNIFVIGDAARVQDL
jgi:hypothetical protein